ncbi:MAG: outer membrane lipoprotein chaperone LolA [Gammaproteobacteria bacterium]|nr:outer membrane lipoprotein chaperone LolA [Gammaproteobacteria bacterium]
MNIRTFIAMATMALSAASAAGAPGADVGEALVESFVVDVKTLSARFEQRLIDASGEILEVSSGTLTIERPGRFRWAYVEPYEQQLVADGVNIWSYDVDLAQVTVKPQADALANTPALLLGGSDAAMDEFEYDGSYEAGGLTWARLRPIDTESGFKRVELAFSNGVLARMVFHDNLEQTTLVSLYEVTVNEPVSASHFEFVAPDGVDVVGTPAAAGVESGVADDAS